MRNKPFQIYVTETKHKEFLLKLLKQRANRNVYYMHDVFLLTRDLNFLTSRPCSVKDPTPFTVIEFTDEMYEELMVLPCEQSQIVYLFGE